MSVTMGRRLASAMVAPALVVPALLAMSASGPLPYAEAAAVDAGTVRIGSVEVARSLGVRTEAQLVERLRQGYVHVEFVDGQLASVAPLSYHEELRAGNTVCPPYFRWWCGR